MSFALLLTIALGVGSNAAVYGFLLGLIHPATPIKDTGRLVSVFRQDRSGNAGPLSSDEYQRIKGIPGVFEWLGAAHVGPRSVVLNGYSEIATVAAITPELGGALSLPLSSGAAISHRKWENEFSGKESVIGSRIRVGQSEKTIENLAPEKLDGLYSDQSVDLWIPAEGQDLAAGERRVWWVVARLRKDVSIHQAQDALDVSGGARGAFTVVPFTGLAPNMARGLSRVGIFLTFSAAAVLFIACINVASFLLGRALRRSHETSLRVALGASRSDLWSDLLADSVVIAVAGGAVGLLLGLLTARALPAFLFEEDAQRLSFAPHLLPIFIAAVVCAFIVVLCGMMPVVGTVTDRPWMILQRETGSPSRGILRLRSALVVGQITLCCMLVVCTAILRAGLHTALQTGAGQRLGDPVLLTVQAQIARNGPEVDTRYFNEVEEKARSADNLFPLAWTNRLPGNQPAWRSFRIQQSSAQFRQVEMDVSWLTPESMQTVEPQPIAGRIFGLDDQRYKVAVVNEEGAAEIFGKRSAGVLIRDSADIPIEIIGVVRRKQAIESEGSSGPAKGEVRPTIYYGYLNEAEPATVIKNAHFRVPRVEPAPEVELSAKVVSPGYFGALGMPLVAGGDFSGVRASGEGRMAVLNQEAADLYFNGKPLGSGVIDDNGVRTEIIGVVKSQLFGAFEQHAEPTIYFPMRQDCPPRMTLMLRTPKWNREMAAQLRQRIEHVPGGSEGFIIVTRLDEQLAQSGLAPLRIATLIGSVSSGIALLLGILGLLNAQSDAERQRQRDRAVRIALGAQRWRIVLLVMKTAAQLAFAGTALGIFLTLTLIRLLMADFAGLASPRLEVWAVASLIPAAAVLIASLIPARRASAIAPSVIMREN